MWPPNDGMPEAEAFDVVAAALPLIDLTLAHDPDSAGGRLCAIKGRLFEATKMHMWDTMIRLTQDRKGEIPAVTLYRGAAAHHLGRLPA